jgi:hypothetical protein
LIQRPFQRSEEVGRAEEKRRKSIQWKKMMKRMRRMMMRME